MALGLGLPRMSWPGLDPLGHLRRMDAAYRERRHVQELAPEQLLDMGLTAADVARILDR